MAPRTYPWSWNTLMLSGASSMVLFVLGLLVVHGNAGIRAAAAAQETTGKGLEASTTITPREGWRFRRGRAMALEMNHSLRRIVPKKGEQKVLKPLLPLQLSHQSQTATWRFSSCEKCPGSTQPSRHTGYQAFAHWTLKPGAANFLPQRPCPPRTQAALAQEAITNLASSGYTRVAGLLKSTRVLEEVTEPVTVLAPTDEAFLLGNLPVHLFRIMGDGGVKQNLIRLHTLGSFRSYRDILRGPGGKGNRGGEGGEASPDVVESFHSTLLGEMEVRAVGFSSGSLNYVKLSTVASQAPAALVVRGNLFCNPLVIIHGINKVLIPLAKHLPANTPPAPTIRQEAAKEAYVTAEHLREGAKSSMGRMGLAEKLVEPDVSGAGEPNEKASVDAGKPVGGAKIGKAARSIEVSTGLNVVEELHVKQTSRTARVMTS